MSEKTYKTGGLVSSWVSESIQFQCGRHAVDLVIRPQLVAFFLEHVIDENDAESGLLRNVLLDVDNISIIPGVLVPVGHERLRNAQREVRFVETNVDKILRHGISFLIRRRANRKTL